MYTGMYNVYWSVQCILECTSESHAHALLLLSTPDTNVTNGSLGDSSGPSGHTLTMQT